MSRSRAYDYASPCFGGFAVPLYDTTYESPFKRDRAAQLRKQESMARSANLSRGNSREGVRAPLDRVDSLSSRTEARNYTTTSESSSYGNGTGRPSTFSSTSYQSPYGNNYRSYSYK